MAQDLSGCVSIVVPARDEATTIRDVLAACRPMTDDLVVIDGHSTDGTVDIAEEFGARVVLDHGLGKGDAVRLALEVVRKPITVFIDADGSHDTDDIPKLVAPILADEADLVIGSRMTGGSDELFSDLPEAVRLFGSTLITLTINYRFGVRMTDYQNGFRAIRTDVGRKLGLKSNLTTIEQEMAMKALKYGYRVHEVPAHEYRRKGGQSKIQIFRVAHVYVWNLLSGVLIRSKRPSADVDASRRRTRR